MKRFLPFIILFIVALLYTKPFFHEGFFPTHDGEWAVIRAAEMQREIKDIQIPPRWADYLNHGFGYPLFQFTYPLPFYLTTGLRVLHFSLVDAVKTVFIGSVFLSALFMYLLGRELAGNYAGLLTAIFYVIAPFRLVDLYVRGSIGESLSLALFPALCFVGMKYVLKPNIPRMIITSIVLSMLILSHNIMSLVFFPLWLIFLYVTVISYFEDVRLYTWKYFLPLILLGFGLAAYFFVPAILEKKYLVLSTMKLAPLKDNFITIPQYLISPWSYGIKPSFQLGWAHIMIALVGLGSIIFGKSIEKRKFQPLAIFVYSGIAILVFLAHPFSAEFWNTPPLKWFDFPWRLLTPLAFFISLSAVMMTLHKSTKILAAVLAVLTVLLSLRFAQPLQFTSKPESYYATNDATTTSMDELMPVWVKNKPTDRYKQKAEIEVGSGTILGLNHTTDGVDFKVISGTPSKIKINTVYFPGWQFRLNGKEQPLTYDNGDGLIRFDVPTGNFLVSGHYGKTTVRKVADFTTVASLIATFILLIYHSASHIRKKNA